MHPREEGGLEAVSEGPILTFFCQSPALSVFQCLVAQIRHVSGANASLWRRLWISDPPHSNAFAKNQSFEVESCWGLNFSCRYSRISVAGSLKL